MEVFPSVSRRMVFISSPRVKRTPRQKLIRRIIGVISVAAIIYMFSLLPYEILREERSRLFGEVHTTGIITSLHTTTADGGSQLFVDYKYIDQDGYARHASARLPQDIWQNYRPGSRIEVAFARTQPSLSRINHEIEPAFQIWLRNILH